MGQQSCLAKTKKRNCLALCQEYLALSQKGLGFLSRCLMRMLFDNHHSNRLMMESKIAVSGKPGKCGGEKEAQGQRKNTYNPTQGKLVGDLQTCQIGKRKGNIEVKLSCQPNDHYTQNNENVNIPCKMKIIIRHASRSSLPLSLFGIDQLDFSFNACVGGTCGGGGGGSNQQQSLLCSQTACCHARVIFLPVTRINHARTMALVSVGLQSAFHPYNINHLSHGDNT